MPYRIIVISFLLFFQLILRGQEKISYPEADKESYALYLSQEWRGLIKYASESRKQGVDFFYLQVRTGIAMYNLGEYRNASHWFVKAYQTDNTLEWLQEYLYYSLIYGGRTLEAKKYAMAFTENIKHKIGYKTSQFTGLAYEAGYGINSDFDGLKSRDFPTELNLGSDYGEGYFLKSYSFQSLNLSHQLAPNFSLSHNLTYIGLNRETTVDWDNRNTSNNMVHQFQYLLNPTWVIGKKLNISPSVNVLFGRGEIYSGGFDNAFNKVFTLKTNVYTDLVFSTALWSDFKNFSPGAEVNMGNINNESFGQVSGWVTYYPLSNLSLYVTPRIYFKKSSESNGLGWNAFEMAAGLNVWKMHIAGRYLFGDLKNFVGPSGYVVDNFPGKSDRKLVGNLYFPLGKKYQFVMRYINQNIIETYQVYTNGVKSGSMDYHYTKQTITGGISWNF